MDEGPDQIEEHITSTRRELGSNLRELENRVKDATDWRVQFERHPWAFLGAAFAGGMLLSAGLGGGRRAARYARERWRDAEAAASSGSWRGHSATTELWNKIKSGLAASAGAQISGFLSELIPGFGSSDRDRGYRTYRATARPQRTFTATNGGSTHEDVAPAGTAAGPRPNA